MKGWGLGVSGFTGRGLGLRVYRVFVGVFSLSGGFKSGYTGGGSVYIGLSEKGVVAGVLGLCRVWDLKVVTLGLCIQG